jgi:hypothetical protein
LKEFRGKKFERDSKGSLSFPAATLLKVEKGERIEENEIKLIK